jgi:transcriptional regulator with XRE-family HTH domain
LPSCHLALRGKKPRDEAYPAELKTLGDHLRKRRLDLGLLQREVAANIGSDTTSVTNWEKGRAEPEIRFLPAIWGFLGYDPRPKPTTIGERLVAYRLGRGWARPRLARELGIDPSTLARWERGARLPFGVYCARIEALFSQSAE